MDYVYKNYKRRIIVAIMLLLSTILLVVGLVTHSWLKRTLEYEFGLAAQSVAVSVAAIISKDMDNYLHFMDTRDVSSEYYRDIRKLFNEIKSASKIRYIYTINQLDDVYIEFILDAEPLDDPYYSAPGDTEEMTDTSLQVFRTKQPAILSPTYSSFGGVLLGGSAPILDENGNLHGIVGVSIDNSQVFATTKNLYITLIIISVSFLLLIWFLLTKVSHFFLEPMLKDKLTGAYNKRYFEAMLQKGIEVSLKAGQDLAVLMLDLDYFKKINDTYGHPFGDVVLAKVSSLIRDCLRKDDFLVRYGGEEFAVLLFNLDNYAAITVAERIRRLIEAYEIHNEKEKIDVKITISIGIANLRHKKLSSSELVNNADKALYKAKETRNAVAEFTE